MALHDARRFTGTHVEVHQDTDFFRSFSAEVRAAAARWDGRELMRSLAPEANREVAGGGRRR